MSQVVICTPQEFEDVLMKLLKDYGDKVYGICRVSAREAGREATKELKSSAPSGGKYARGWTHKSEADGLTKYTEIVYNRGKEASLTHLLEKPHDTGHGGHYPKRVDYTGTIAAVEEKYKTQFMEDIKSRL